MAVTDPTPNYGWELPNVGGDSGNWGTMLRTILGEAVTGLDAVLFAVSTVANAALARAGGTMTGLLYVLTEKFTVVNSGNLTGAVSMSLTAANTFYGTATGNYQLSFTNIPATGAAVFVTLFITNGGAYTTTWPANTRWPGGAPPALTTSGVDIVTFVTRDGGTNWYAAVSMLDLS